MDMIIISDCCIGVPKNSVVKVIEEDPDHYSMIYKDMWFGKYHKSLFTNHIKETKE